MLKLRLLHPLLWGLLLVLEEVASQQNRCGLVPTEVFLKKGERKQLIFWTDQNYENITTALPLEGSTEPNNGVDSFLEAVNGGLPIPSTSSNDTESYPEFIGQPEVSSTEAPPQEESTTEQGTTPVTTTFDSLTTVNTEENLETTTFPFESTTMEITEMTTDNPIETTEDTVIQAFNEPNVTTEKISILQPSAVVTQPPDLEGEVVQVLIASTIKMEDLTTTMQPIETTTIPSTITEIRNEETTTEELEEESTLAVEDTTNKLEVVGELEVEDDLSMEIAELQDEILHDDTETEVDFLTPDSETSSDSPMLTSTLANAETSLGTEAVETTTGAIATQEPNESTSFETTTLSDSETEASISGDYLGETDITSENIDDLILDDDTNEEEETEQTGSTSIDTTIAEETETTNTPISVEQVIETEPPVNEVNETVMEDDSVDGAKEEKIDANLIIDEATTASQSEVESTTTETVSPDQSQDTESPTLTFDDMNNEDEAIETTANGDLTTTQRATSIVENDVVIELNQQELPNGTDAPAEEFEDIILDDDTDYYPEGQSETTTSNGIESTTYSVSIPQVDGSDTSKDEETINVDSTTVQPTTPEESLTTIEVHEEDQFGEVEEQVEEIVDIILDDDVENEDNTETTTNSEIESTTEAIFTTSQPNTAEELTSDEAGTVVEMSIESVIEHEPADLGESENVNTEFPSETNFEATEAPTASFADVILDDDTNDIIDEPEITTQNAGLSIVSSNTPAPSTSEESQTNENTITEKPSDEEQGFPLVPESTTEEQVTTATEIVPETTENVAILADGHHDYTDSAIQFDDPEENEEVDYVVTEEVATEAVSITPDEDASTIEVEGIETTTLGTSETGNNFENLEEAPELQIVKIPDENAFNTNNPEEFQITEQGLGAVLTNIISKIQEEAFGSGENVASVQSETNFTIEIQESTRNKTQEIEILLQNGEKGTDNASLITSSPEIVLLEESTEPISITRDISDDILYDDESEDIEKTMVFIVPDNENSLSPSVLTVPVPDVITQNLTLASELGANLPAEAQPQIVSQKTVIFQETTTGSPLDAPFFAPIELELIEFKDTTTGSPLDDPQEAKEEQATPIFAAVESEDIEEPFEFSQTTTGSPLDNQPQQDREDPPLNFAAIEQEEQKIEYADTTTGSSNDIPIFAPIEVDPIPFEFTETTTGIPLVAKSSNGSVLDIDQSTKVDGPLDLENIQYYDDPEDYQSGFSEDTKTSLSQSKLGTAQRLDLVLNKPSEDLERMTRKEDEDAIVDAQGLQDLSPYRPKINTSDPGSLLTTILDGILSSKPRPPPQAPQLNHKRTTVKPLPIIVTEEAPLPPTTTDDGFPVSNLLNGIYRLVSSYITPRPIVEPLVTEMDFTPPDSTTSKTVLLPINVHNTRREELNEKVDNQYSKTDPFVQLQAPDLRKDGETGEQQMLFPVPIPKESVSTFSPFNSPALKIQKPPQIQGPRNKEELAGPLPISAPVGDVPNSQEIFYPGNYLRGGSTSQKETKSSSNPQIGPSSAPYLSLVDNQRNRDPVSIPLPGLLGENENNYRRDSRPTPIEDNNSYDAIGSIRRGEESFYRFINAQPLPIQRGILDPANRDQRSKRQLDETSPLEDETSSSNSSEPINCNWSIKTEQGLYLLVTFHNLSAPFTVDCQGAYIEVERENNGFEARWCGNRVTQGGSRPHVIFAKNEVRISVFDDGSLGKELPTGFSADVEVIDLYDGEQYSNLSKTNAYSNVRLLNG